MTFCKACGTLSPMGTCPKGHESTLTDKIKNVIKAEDGTRVLVSDNDASLGNKFWSYACEHRKRVYVLKMEHKKPASFLRIPHNVNPCAKWRGNDSETYNLKDLLISNSPYEKTAAERSLEQAKMNLYNWPNGSSKM